MNTIETELDSSAFEIDDFDDFYDDVLEGLREIYRGKQPGKLSS